MFHVPRYSGGHPRLTLVVIVTVMLVAIAALIGWISVRPSAAAPEAEAPAPRPPVEVVETLPMLKEQLDRWGASGQFTGGVLVARGDEVLFRQVHGYADRATGATLQLNSRFRLASVSKQFT
ncbi:MAG TPA: serine hydrolase, partial [Brevundimonas sp.]|nr:serine hydrolase [Brevundimonas sp.]